MSKTNEEIQLNMAEQQLIGFGHASQGFRITELADSMGLTKKEWIKLRENAPLKELDKKELDDFFNKK